MLLTPDKKPAHYMDRIMLLAMWARHLSQEIEETTTSSSFSRPIIVAGLGKPTFPLNLHIAKSMVKQWTGLLRKSRRVRGLLNKSTGRINFDEAFTGNAHVVGYGQPQGDLSARNKIARAFSRWYGDHLEIKANNILFTVGGAGALYIIFTLLNQKYPNGIIITPFPHYGLYSNPFTKNNLFPIPVMNEKGYQLTANLFLISLEEALSQAKNDNTIVSAFLLCDPNNPLGTCVKEEELYKIAGILRNHPEILIILDEAYAEMRFDKTKSFLTIAPDLKRRILLLRSGTKAFSVAGEREAVILGFNEDLMYEMCEISTNIYGHPPRTLQHAFAEAMDKLDDAELINLNNYYREQVEYAAIRLKQMKIAMPDPSYRVTGTFYILCDLSELFGLPLPRETQRALNKAGKIQTDEDIAYYLLFNDGLMLAPLSYYGLSNNKGYIRITCSGGMSEMKELMDRLENRLVQARKTKQLEVSCLV